MGPFTVEATIPTPVDFDADGVEDSQAQPVEEYARFADRMLEALRRAPVLRVAGNKTVTFRNVRVPAKTLSLSAEAVVANGTDQPVAFVFGPENGSVSDKLVFNAAKEANGKNYTHLYVVGFAIEPEARQAVERCGRSLRHPRDLRPGHAGPHHGRPAEEHPREPGLQRLRAPRGAAHEAQEEGER
jgi:adenine-specific DNA-methyltransferase